MKAVDETRKTTLKHYTPRVNELWENYKILDWGDKESQFKRFEIFSSQLTLKDKSLVDIGCGLGDLIRYLKQVDNIPNYYLGTDLVEEMIALAKKQQPNLDFRCFDIFAKDSKQKFDVVFSSGIFNLNTGNNLEFFGHVLKSLPKFTHATSTVVFNFLHERTVSKYDHCFYYNPEELVSLATAFYDDVQIIDNYLPNDFTLILQSNKLA